MNMDMGSLPVVGVLARVVMNFSSSDGAERNRSMKICRRLDAKGRNSRFRRQHITLEKDEVSVEREPISSRSLRQRYSCTVSLNLDSDHDLESVVGEDRLRTKLEHDDMSLVGLHSDDVTVKIPSGDADEVCNRLRDFADRVDTELDGATTDDVVDNWSHTDEVADEWGHSRRGGR